MLRTRLASALEEGKVPFPLAADALWARAARRRVVRPLRWPDGLRVIAVGGATLGGSGKTPLAIACAVELARAGVRVAFVGHAHGAAPGRARWVRADDDVRVVGDEGLLAARRLHALGVPVAVGPTRQAAIDLAAPSSDVVIVDGPLQCEPRRAALSLLAVDAHAPWGAGMCPPCGDLNAPVSTLLRCSDRIVAIGEGVSIHPTLRNQVYVRRARVVSEGAWVQTGKEGSLLPWPTLRAARIGVWLTIARPTRILDGLARRAVNPVVVLRSADHRSPEAAVCRQAARWSSKVDLWLCTDKCAMHLESEVVGRPVGRLAYNLVLPSELVSELVGAAGLALTPTSTRNTLKSGICSRKGQVTAHAYG